MNGLNKTEPAICGWIHWGDPRSLAPSRSFPHANACENRRWRAFSMLIWVQEGSGRPRCSVWHSVTSVGSVQTGVEGCPKDLSNLFYFFHPPRLNLLLKLSASSRMFLRHYWQKPKWFGFTFVTSTLKFKRFSCLVPCKVGNNEKLNIHIPNCFNTSLLKLWYDVVGAMEFSRDSWKFGKICGNSPESTPTLEKKSAPEGCSHPNQDSHFGGDWIFSFKVSHKPSNIQWT